MQPTTSRSDATPANPRRKQLQIHAANNPAGMPHLRIYAEIYASRSDAKTANPCSRKTRTELCAMPLGAPVGLQAITVNSRAAGVIRFFSL